jgi:hypothetical protein
MAFMPESRWDWCHDAVIWDLALGKKKGATEYDYIDHSDL